MARGNLISPNFKQNFETYINSYDSESIEDVEDLKESLRSGLSDARKKITTLRNEVKEKQKSLDRERQMREKAEQELSNISLSGPRILSTPVPPDRLHNNIQSPVPRTGTPNGYTVEKLIEELKSARSLNRALTEKLSQREKDMEALEQSKEEMRLELEASAAAKNAALIDKIHTAQKEREAAVMTRLKLLTDEKQELQKRLKKIEKDHGFDSGVDTGSLFGEDVNTDQLALNEVLDRVISSNETQSIELHGDVMVNRLNSAQSFRWQKASEDYTKIKSERDQALKKVQRLEEDLREIQQEREVMETQHRKNEKNRLKAMQNQLKKVIEERDEACVKAQGLKQELEQLKLQQSLRSSLSHEKELRNQFNNTLDEFETKFYGKESEVRRTKQLYEESQVKLNSTIREKKVLAEQLEDVIKQAKEEKEKAHRLERLVSVIRKRNLKSISETIS